MRLRNSWSGVECGTLLKEGSWRVAVCKLGREFGVPADK